MMKTIRELLKISEATEPKRQPKTKTKTKVDSLSGIFQRSFDQSILDQDQDQLPTIKQQVPTPTLRKASAAKTAARANAIPKTADVAKRLSAIRDLALTDVLSDEEVLSRINLEKKWRPVTPTTLPARVDQLATINNALVKTGEVSPEWHQVRNLPGYLQQGIRAMGRQVFSAITRTPIEDIYVIADLMGSGEPNSAREINAVAGWLKTNAVRDTEGEINFQRKIPDYSVDFKLYKINNQTFMLVKDFAGHYIYTWPSGDEINHTPTRSLR